MERKSDLDILFCRLACVGDNQLFFISNSLKYACYNNTTKEESKNLDGAEVVQNLFFLKGCKTDWCNGTVLIRIEEKIRTSKI